MSQHQTYDQVKATLNSSSTQAREERVEVNQRALIDKILARYASAGAVYRELLQNSNDANATTAELYFAVAENGSVTSVTYRNNGMPFRPQDWSRLKKIAEGNPDESKIGAFGVGAYAMFSIAEEPMVLSGTQALCFIWKGDALWTKTIDNKRRQGEESEWTSFVLPSRDPYPLPDMKDFGSFLVSALTFTKSLKEIRLYVNDQQRLKIVKTELTTRAVQVQHQSAKLKISSWWKQPVDEGGIGGAITHTPNGLFRLKEGDESSLQESFYKFDVSVDGQASVSTTARYLTAEAQTNIPSIMVKRMERVTKKKPPRKVTLQLFLNGQRIGGESHEGHGHPKKKRGHKTKSKQSHLNLAHSILKSLHPPLYGGRIFIGFKTSQTTGFACHVAAPFVPTVEREAMDLQDATLREFNLELLQFAGILLRLTLEHGMMSLGEEFEQGAAERLKQEKELKEKKRKKGARDEGQTKPTLANGSARGDSDDLSSDNDSDDDDDEKKDEAKQSSSAVWGFAKFMAKGVKKKIVQVLHSVEDYVDDELLNPSDERPICTEEEQAIVLMQSFSPRQSTPDPLVGTALAQGFGRCIQDRAPPVLCRDKVTSADKARLPYKGIESFCTENVIRKVVFTNAEEYHTLVARCREVTLGDLALTLGTNVLEFDQAVRFLKWWPKIARIQPDICQRYGPEIKESLKFFASQKGDKILALRDYLFFLDESKVQTSNGFDPAHLPMPESLIPRSIQKEVGTRILSDSFYHNWFEALPLDVWGEFISHHRCLNAGQPEDEMLRLQALSILNHEFMRRSYSDQKEFGFFCQHILKDRKCIPFDSEEPTLFCADVPANLYLQSAELAAFSGVGSFHKAASSLNHFGISDDFLLAIGVRKSVAIDFLFAHLDSLQWNEDPKPLIDYLRSASLTSQDLKKLKSSRYLPSETDTSRMFAPNELYLPHNKELRLFPFVQMLQWPSEDELSEGSSNGKFLIGLGMKSLPPLETVLRYISSLEDSAMRLQCLKFVWKRLDAGGTYHTEYSRIGRSTKSVLKLLPCTSYNPFDHSQTSGVYSITSCFFDRRCSIMGFTVVDLGNDDNSKLVGELFGCVSEPDSGALVKQLKTLVSLARTTSNKAGTGREREETTVSIIAAFNSIFAYLSSRSSDMSSTTMYQLRKEAFIPVSDGGSLRWLPPEEVYFKSDKEETDLTDTLFTTIEFPTSGFLMAAGVRQEPSTSDIFEKMIRDPKSVKAAVRSEANYRALLRRVAAQKPFKSVTNEIRSSAFLIAYTITEDKNGNTKSVYDLAKAEDIYIIDNSFFGRMFGSVKRAPHESDLEEFYAMIGSKYISKVVAKEFDVLGDTKADSELTKALAERIKERSPLLVSPSVTSRPLVKNAAKVLAESNLKLLEAEQLKAVYSLEKSTRSQKTTCCSQPLSKSREKHALYVTKDFDWFDVGYAIGELILVRCQLEDAFFISSLLETPLEQLRARGFPVDRIIRPEPPPEPIIPPKVTATDAKRHSSASKVSSDRAATIADIPPQSINPPKQTPTTEPTQSDASNSGYDSVLTEAYPDADPEYIHNRLGPNPSYDKVAHLAEEMSQGNYPKKTEVVGKDDPTVESQGRSTTEPTSPSPMSLSKPSKFLGSRKLGKALGGLRNSSSSRLGTAGGIAGPSTNNYNSNVPVPPERDASSHAGLEQLLKNTIGQSSKVNEHGIQSAPQTQVSIPEGLDRGDACEVIPGQNLKPFTRRLVDGKTHNGIRVFSARQFPESERFLESNLDVVESFAVVLERIARLFELRLDAVAIFHDPSGGTIAFNAGKALHFNLRFYYALHYDRHNISRGQSSCYSYWFVTTCHELAHHMASGHNKEHGFYTESYISTYLPKLAELLAQI